jgi:hypothetical protein
LDPPFVKKKGRVTKKNVFALTKVNPVLNRISVFLLKNKTRGGGGSAGEQIQSFAHSREASYHIHSYMFF